MKQKLIDALLANGFDICDAMQLVNEVYLPELIHLPHGTYTYEIGKIKITFKKGE